MSYNTIILQIENFCDNHHQIKSVGNGFTSDYNTFLKNNQEGYYIFIQPTGVNMLANNNIVRYNLNIICADIVPLNDDIKNTIQTEVISDTAKILFDLSKYFKLYAENNKLWTIQNTQLNITPFTNRGGDLTTGWQLSISLELPIIYNDCDIPMLDVIPPGFDPITGLPTTQYLTCETVGNCPVIISLQDQIDNIEVSWGNIEGDIQNQIDLILLLDDKANVVHTHVEDDITNLDKYTKEEVDNLLLWEIADALTDEHQLKVPTEQEWLDELATWVTLNKFGAFDSILKLTSSGVRTRLSGLVINKTVEGLYTSATINGASIKPLLFNNTVAQTTNTPRANGLNLRLIVDGSYTLLEYQEQFENKTINIRGLNYGYVYNPTTEKVWLDRNLGSPKIADSFDDEDAYGDYYQWGRGTDGHEKITSSVTNVISTTATPPHGDFITSSSFSNNWITTLINNLWQGVNGINTPVGSKLIGKNFIKADYNDLLNLPTITGGLTCQTLADCSTFQDLEKDFTYNIDLTGELVKVIYAIFDMKINSVSNLVGVPTTTILVNALPYTFGDVIAQGSEIEITVSVNSVININGRYE